MDEKKRKPKREEEGKKDKREREELDQRSETRNNRITRYGRFLLFSVSLNWARSELELAAVLVALYRKASRIRAKAKSNQNKRIGTTDSRRLNLYR